MHKLAKLAFAAGACAVLTGCPVATSVRGEVSEWKLWGPVPIKEGAVLRPIQTLQVHENSSLTVKYDNGKSCTFDGPMEVVPGTDGSICEKKDEKKDEKKEEKKDEQQDPQQQDQAQAQDNSTGNGQDGGNPGINAPAVTPTSVPDYSPGIGGPQVIATAASSYTPGNFVGTTTNLLEAIVGIVAVKKAGDKLDDNRDKPVSP